MPTMKISKIALQQLAQHNIKPSVQRLAILKLLLSNKKRPTVDMIYGELKKQLPTLSRATVYNTLNLFTQQGMVREICIDPNEKRYDMTSEPLAYLRCGSCGKLCEIGISPKLCKRLSQLESEHHIEGFDLYLRGYCKECAARSTAQTPAL